LAETERLVESVAELSSLALRVEALVECVLELGVIAETLAVASAAGDILGVGPALGDTAWSWMLVGYQTGSGRQKDILSSSPATAGLETAAADAPMTAREKAENFEKSMLIDWLVGWLIGLV